MVKKNDKEKKGKEEEIARPHGHGGSYFFKVMLPSSLQEMHLPPKFVPHIIREKRKIATLKGPQGRSWRIKVHRHGTGFYLGEGWQEFVEAHSLDVGYFLVFKYEGNMNFDVIIFDRSACEKEYTADERCISGFSRRQTRCSSRKWPAELLEIVEYTTEEAAAVGASTDGQSSNEERNILPGPHFKATIMPYNLVKNKPYMSIPSTFQSAHRLWSKHLMIMKDPERRSWPVKIYHRRSGSYIQSNFGSGWHNFCVHNHLKEGDACLFELALEEKIDTMRVHISRK